MNEKPTIDKINSFIAHIDSQYEKLNDPNYMGFTDSSMQTPSTQKGTYRIVELNIFYRSTAKFWSRMPIKNCQNIIMFIKS